MQTKTVSVFPDKALGPIRPLHGVGGGPVSSHFTFDATELFRAAGIPFGRTHDIEYPFGSGEFVDVHCIFPFFDADENDPASYNFTLTDEYLRLMLKAGTRPFYRLGSAIEHQPIKRHIHPPRDYGKFARICSHIVAHYNEGWANGHHWDIRYWEIWNEPDIPQCWTGTQEEIFDLYRTTACLLKREHPDIRVGGLALTSPWSKMFEPFLAYARDHAVPLDFVSWHGYCHTPLQARDNALKARELMDRYGFCNAESIYDEWNYMVDWNDVKPSMDLHHNAFAAAFMAAVISAVQQTKTDKLMFYDAQMLFSDWNNLFTPRPMKVHAAARKVDALKGYWTLYGWNELYRAGTQIFCEAGKDLWCTAARSDDGKLFIYIAYYNDDAGLNACPPPDARVELFSGGRAPGRITLRRVDETHDFEPETVPGGAFVMKGNSFALAELDENDPA
ncbi:MAG: hypothetical protein J6U63_03195 [Clostridia bacterium]|nr:hypothetical protein [Clostridia bacterium]